MPRPRVIEKVDRVKLAVYVTEEQRKRIDKARRETPRSDFMRDAVLAWVAACEEEHS